MANLPKLSIAAKLYVIFALLAAAAVILALVAVVNARRHAALTEEFEAASHGLQYVERLNGLIYAVRLEALSIYLSPDPSIVKTAANNLIKLNDRIGGILTEWQWVVRSDDVEQFQALSGRVKQFQETGRALVSRASAADFATTRHWRGGEGTRDVRNAINNDLETFGQLYSHRAKRAYAEINKGIELTAWVTSPLGAIAILLAAAGAITIRRAVARPLAEIARITEAVAEGSAVAVPYGARRDEIGALARSISVFQNAMLRNKELNRTVIQDTEIRASRQENMSAEIAYFTAQAEGSITELSVISKRMLEASTQLAAAADHASTRTASATASSDEASNNVRDIASAADELTASVMEIDRQVTQSNSIAEKAVNEAGRTNLAVKELDEAAKRIGDVVRLITDIAEQTNLLALNATIEAARAGNAGRGFAVVAGEVKALAGQTAKATEDIAAQIAGMQQATTRSIEAIGAIERTIRDLGAISGAIAAAVTEQGAATQEIARSVEIAARHTIATAEEVGQVGEATMETRTNATTVKSVADDLGAIAARIRSQIDAFFQGLRAA